MLRGRRGPYGTRRPREKTCKQCRTRYMPAENARPFENWCSPECGALLARAAQMKAQERRRQKEARELKARKEAIKPRSKWLSEAQKAVNAFVRIRDHGRPCISCDWPDDGRSQRHASHYRSVAAASAIRFSTWNIHASCAQCNTMKSGNLLEYRIRLVKKIGQERIDWLEQQNQTADYSIEYLKRVKRIFTKRAKIYKRIRGIT